MRWSVRVVNHQWPADVLPGLAYQRRACGDVVDVVNISNFRQRPPVLASLSAHGEDLFVSQFGERVPLAGYCSAVQIFVCEVVWVRVPAEVACAIVAGHARIVAAFAAFWTWSVE